MEDLIFATTFGNYPFERYIFEKPQLLDEVFGDVLITEIFESSAELKQNLDAWPHRPEDLHVKIKGADGRELRLPYLTFSTKSRKRIRDIFRNDLSESVFDDLRKKHENHQELTEKINQQKTLITQKYGTFKVKEYSREMKDYWDHMNDLFNEMPLSWEVISPYTQNLTRNNNENKSIETV